LEEETRVFLLKMAETAGTSFISYGKLPRFSQCRYNPLFKKTHTHKKKKGSCLFSFSTPLHLMALGKRVRTSSRFSFLVVLLLSVALNVKMNQVKRGRDDKTEGGL
jgi:hypothetical protein